MPIKYGPDQKKVQFYTQLELKEMCLEDEESAKTLISLELQHIFNEGKPIVNNKKTRGLIFFTKDDENADGIFITKNEPHLTKDDLKEIIAKYPNIWMIFFSDHNIPDDAGWAFLKSCSGCSSEEVNKIITDIEEIKKSFFEGAKSGISGFCQQRYYVNRYDINYETTIYRLIKLLYIGNSQAFNKTLNYILTHSDGIDSRCVSEYKYLGYDLTGGIIKQLLLSIALHREEYKEAILKAFNYQPQWGDTAAKIASFYQDFNLMEKCLAEKNLRIDQNCLKEFINDKLKHVQLIMKYRFLFEVLGSDDVKSIVTKWQYVAMIFFEHKKYIDWLSQNPDMLFALVQPYTKNEKIAKIILSNNKLASCHNCFSIDLREKLGLSDGLFDAEDSPIEEPPSACGIASLITKMGAIYQLNSKSSSNHQNNPTLEYK